jgi:hypothetical protein
MLTFHIIGHTSNFWRCRSASVSATAAVRSIAVEDENVDSASSEDSKKLGMNEVADSSVWPASCYYLFFHFSMLLNISFHDITLIGVKKKLCHNLIPLLRIN